MRVAIMHVYGMKGRAHGYLYHTTLSLGVDVSPRGGWCWCGYVADGTGFEPQASHGQMVTEFFWGGQNGFFVGHNDSCGRI
jgi:hypothetical protein